MNKYKITDEEFWNQINNDFGTKGGVYKLFSIQNSKIFPVNRVLGIDSEGILYIGKADSFLDRVIVLKKTLKYKSEGHIGGNRYNKFEMYGKKFPLDTLHVQLIQSDDPKALEDNELNNYQEKFGEVPPLNAI